ncbi:Crp/Fnr family transcriptional regulator [Mesonia sp.]|uniref:Crp/Fnr family transcriptional regulator n=1 Tax=Mesonia sp. TaxID=1960830 RepID=UPI00175403D0|nr:Crp/Fnr family transcriptional regulator [Mesonia sp.]HIB37136.1 Crp/Fnr family transcriptional regulator [Mesonia sp.]HIO26430.1 Crp/Fnr family transcriptional regulator [Flavobacteriaceae bacterium]
MNSVELQQNYGGLFQPELVEEINKVAIFKEVEAGEELIKVGDYIRSMPLILTGAIKILREDENGDELLLYFLEKGDTCAMTLACCIGSKKSEIKAVAETDATLLMIPVQKMEEWSSKYKSWRNFVFDSYHHRLMEVLQSIDNIAFSKLDDRLIKYLQHKKKLFKSNLIEITHQEIARDLNSSRVVISRLLKKLENQHAIELHRNSIKLLAV